MQNNKYSLPFDFYDFSILFPGFLMFIYIGSILHFLKPSFDAYFLSIEYLSNNTLMLILIAIILIIGFYIIGHFVATIGSLVLDRVFLYGIFGLPVYYILDLDHFKRSYVEATYKHIFFISNLFLLLILVLQMLNVNLTIIMYVGIILICLMAMSTFFRLFTELLRENLKDRPFFLSLSNSKLIRGIILGPVKYYDMIINLINYS